MSVEFSYFGGRSRMFALGLIAMFSLVLAFGVASARAAEPVATDVFAGTNDVTPVTVQLNGSDDDLDPLTYSVVTPPAGGTLGVINQTSGEVVYTADPTFAGIDSFVYMVTANGEDSNEAIATVTVRPDTSAGGASGLTNDNTPEFTFSSPQAGTIFECRIDGGSYSTCASPFSAPTLDDGAHTFQVRARAGTGGPFDTTPASRNVVVDATAPTPNIRQTSGQGDPTNSSPIAFELIAEEDLNASSVEASDFEVVNGSIDSITGSGTQFDISVIPAADGDVVVNASPTFEVEDLAGNTTSDAGNDDRTVNYDTTAPEVSLEQADGQADPANADLIEFTLGANEPLDLDSITDTDFAITGGTFDSKVAAGNDVTIVVQASGDGEVTIAPSGTFEVADLATNPTITASGADRSVIYDGTLPELTLEQAAGQVDHTVLPAIEFTLGADEPLDGSTVEASDFVITNGSIDSVTGGGDEYTIAVVADAEGDVEIAPSEDFSVSDLAGNAQDSIANGTDRTVLYDTPAEVTLRQADGQVDPTNVSPVSFELIADEPLNAGTVENSDFDVTGGSITNLTGSDAEYLIEVTPSGDGDVAIAPSGTFAVEDSVGNVTAEAAGEDRTVTYDTGNPIATISDGPGAVSADRTPTFVFNSNESPSTFECRLYVDGEAPSDAVPCESPFTSEPLAADEDYIFEVVATDAAGNSSTPDSRSWHISATTITGSAENTPYYTRGGTPVAVSVIASDSEAGTLTYAQVDATDGGTVGSFTVDGKATALYTAADGFAGIETVTIRVQNTDTGGFRDVPVEVAVRPATRLLSGPGVGATPALTNTNLPTFTFDAVSGPGDGVVSGATFTCTLDGNTIPTLDCASGSYTPTVELSEGEHTFTVAASKPSLNTDPQPQSTIFTVDTIAPDAPELSGTNGLVNSDTLTYEFTLPEGTAECRLNDGSDPAWREDCESPDTLEGVADGDYVYEVRTVDAAENRSTVASLNVTVDTVVTVNIDSAPADGNTDGTPAFQFSSDEDPDVAYSCRVYLADTLAEEIPDFADCGETPGSFESPLLDQNASYVFQVKGVDEAGNEIVEGHTWLQDNTAPVPPTVDLTVEANQSIVIPLGSTDADDDVLSYTSTGEVTGGTLGEINQATGDVSFEAAADAHGDHTLSFEVTDSRQGGTVPFTVSLHIQPNTVFTIEPPAQTNETQLTWEFSSPSVADSLSCRLITADDVDPTPFDCTSGTYTSDSDLADGVYTLEVTATKGALSDPTPASSSIEVDTDAPVMEIDDTPVALSNDTTPVFTFHSDDDDPISFQCSIDGVGFNAPEPVEGEEPAEWGDCASGVELAELADGVHEFRVRPIDPATNVGTPESYTWEVDATEPLIELAGAPEGVQNGPGDGKQTNAKRPLWYFERSDLYLDETTVRCRIDGGSWQVECLSPYQPLSNLTDGEHVFEIEADDDAGNTGSLVSNFRVNTVGPSVVISEGPADPSGPDAAFEFQSSVDLGAEGSFACRIKVNSDPMGNWEPCESPLELNGLSGGTRTLQIKAIDSAGNESSGAQVATYSWATVGGIPDTVITGSTKGGTTASFGFKSPGYPLATFRCKLDDGAWEACTSPTTYSDLSAGEHSLLVEATNQVGTVDPTPATEAWTVSAATAPDTTISVKPPAKTAATQASFEFSASVAVATFECRINDGSWEACTSPKSYSELPVGSHKFEVRATGDNDLTDSSPASATWEVTAATELPYEPPVCTPETAKASNGKTVLLAKRLKVRVQLSHRRAIEGQAVSARLLVNGKAPNKAAKKRLKKLLKRVDLRSKTGVVASLKAGKWSSAFEVGADTPSNLVVQVKRKKGGAIRTTVPFTLTACNG